MVKTFEMASALSSHHSSPSTEGSFHQSSGSDSLNSDFSIVTVPNDISIGVGNGSYNNFNESNMVLSHANGDLSYEDLQYSVQQLLTENSKLKETLQKDHSTMKAQTEMMINATEQMELIMENQMEKRNQAKSCIEQLRLENGSLKEALAQAQQDKIAAYECQIRELKTSLENEKIRCHQMKADYDELLIDHNQLKRSYDNAMAEKTVLMANFAELKNKFEEHEHVKAFPDVAPSFQFLDIADAESSLSEVPTQPEVVLNESADVPEVKVTSIPEITEEIVEQTDRPFDDDENERLSLQSAEKSIKNLLTQLGIEQEKYSELYTKFEKEMEKNEELAKQVAEKEEIVSRLSENNFKVQNDESHLKVNLQDSERKYAVANSYIQKYKDRCDSLENWLSVYQGKLDTIKNEDCEVTVQLREEVNNLRKTLEDEKQRSEEDKKQILEEREKNATLLEEHLQLKNTWETMFHEDQNQSSQTEAYYCLQIRAFQEREDAIYAQIVLLEERLKNKEEELEKTHREVLKLKTDLENVPILQAQLDIYKADFNEERRAREALNEEKETLHQELSRLRVEHRGGRTPPATRRSVVSDEWTLAEPVVPEDNVGERENAENPAGQAYVCPKCNFVFDSFQSLLNHINNCLDNEENL